MAVANDTDYGLAGSIFSANTKRAYGLRGICGQDGDGELFRKGDITTPLAGLSSQVLGRDNSLHAHDQYGA